jgi:type II secretion system protein G
MKKQYGFTLIELLIVVAIIAILAAIAIPNFLSAQVRSKVSRTKSDMRSVATALESYCVDNNVYPWTNNGYYTRLQRLQQITTPIAYLSSLPFDVFSSDTDYAQKIYPYWDPPYVFQLAGLNPDGTGSSANTRFDLVPEMKDKIVGSRQPMWVMLTMGPDRDYEPAVSPYQFEIYDPSNGTVSNGDIIRWGP